MQNFAHMAHPQTLFSLHLYSYNKTGRSFYPSTEASYQAEMFSGASMKHSLSLVLALSVMAALAVIVLVAGTRYALHSSTTKTDPMEMPLGMVAPIVLAPRVQQVFYISETPCGGSLKYIQDLIAHYGVYGIQFLRLPNKAATEAAAYQFRKGDILFFQYLLNTDFTFTDVRDLVLRYELCLVIPIHDKYFLNDNPEADYVYHASLHAAEAFKIPSDKWTLLQLATHIVFPSQFIHDIFRAHMKLPSMVVVPHIDQGLWRHLIVPPINQTFHIGVITSPTYYKGLDIMEVLFAKVSEHLGKKVEFFLYSHYDGSRFPGVFARGGYTENDIYTRLDQDGIHGLLFLNRYPETHSYALTKGINSGRPLLYTRMGAVAERLAQENDAQKFIATDNTDVAEKFQVLLDFIQAHGGQGGVDARFWSSLTDSSLVVLPQFYQELFLSHQGQGESA